MKLNDIISCFTLFSIASQPLHLPAQDSTNQAALQKVYLTNSDDVESLSNKLREMKISSGDQTLGVYVLHIKGKRPDPNLKLLLSQLSKNDISVSGSIVSESSFDQYLNNLESLGASQVLDRLLVQYSDQNALNETWVSWFKKHFSIQSLRNLIKTKAKLFFGLPNGVTIVEHFFTHQEGHKTRRFPHDPMIALQTPIITLGSLFGYSASYFDTVGGSLITNLQKPEFLIPNLIYLVWVPLWVYFQREVAAFRLQGKSASFDSTLDSGYQIHMQDNGAFFAATMLIQETVINMLILLSTFPQSNTPQILNAFYGGLLGGFASLLAEYLKGRMYLDGELLEKSGQLREAASLQSQAKWINFIWAMAIYPILKNVQLLGPPMGINSLPLSIFAMAYFLRGYLYGDKMKTPAHLTFKQLTKNALTLTKEKVRPYCQNIFPPQRNSKNILLILRSQGP